MTIVKVTAIIVLVVGIVLLAVSILADFVGVGDQAGFGLQQIGGTVVGLVVAAIGLFLLLRKK